MKTVNNILSTSIKTLIEEQDQKNKFFKSNISKVSNYLKNVASNINNYKQFNCDKECCDKICEELNELENSIYDMKNLFAIKQA